MTFLKVRISFIHWALVIVVFVYLLTAINSIGFYHPDEHYQLIEFSELKAGHNNEADLAWEYAAKIRPAIQPAFCYLFFGILRWIWTNDPYLLSLSLRVFTGILSILVIYFFVQKTKTLLPEKYFPWYFLLSYFLWFLPFANTRFSSETWSGLSFMMAFAMVFSKSSFRYFFMGLFLGLSFIFRFQTVFLSFGLLLWLFFNFHLRLKYFLVIFGGIFIAVLCGTLIDFWFYKSYTLTFLNYFQVNIIEDVASEFGKFPWSFYFSEGIKAAIFPIGVIVIISFLLQIVTSPKSIFSWVLIPFFAVHIIIPHKELRFLFPIINFIPFIIISSYHFVSSRLYIQKWKHFVRFFLYSSLSIIVLINIVAITVNCFSPAGNGVMAITQYIHNNYANSKVNLFYALNSNPYQPYSSLRQKFYEDENINQVYIRNVASIKQITSRPGTNLIVIYKYDLADPDISNAISKIGFRKIKQSTPDWILNLKLFFNYGSTDDTPILFGDSIHITFHLPF